MTRWERFFLVVQRVASVIVLLAALAILAATVSQWLQYQRYQDFEFAGDGASTGSGWKRTLPYMGQQIETAEGSLVAVMQEDPETGERIELDGITIANPKSGKSLVVASGEDASVVQFELIFDQANGGKAVGYLATIASNEQYQQGRMDLVVGALPAMTRSVVARDIRFSDLPQMRGDGSVGILMWPEEDEAYLVAVRLDDGTIIDRVKVVLPRIRENKLSQGGGSGFFQPGRHGIEDAAPVNRFAF